MDNQINKLFSDEFASKISDANTEIYSMDDLTLSFTAVSMEQNKSVVEGTDCIATTIRDGNHFMIAEINKFTGEEKILEYYINTDNLTNCEPVMPVETTDDQGNEIAPQTVEVEWRSYHYPGDGYIYWPNNGVSGAYVLRLQGDEIYTTGNMSSKLKKYADIFTTNVRQANSYYQDACEDLVDLSSVGAAKAVAELITACATDNLTVEGCCSFLISMIGVGSIIAAESCAVNAWNANHCHTKYENAWYDAEPLCVPW